MKIVHMIFSLMNGGKENMLIDIANEQIAMGHDVAIVIINDRIEQSLFSRISSDINSFCLSRSPDKWEIISFLKLFYFLNFSYKPDLIHCHDINLVKIIRFISFTKRLLTLHGLEINSSQMKYYDKLFAISSAVKKDVESRSNYKCQVIYNGVRTDLIQPRNQPNLNDVVQIVSIKRLNHERTGQDVLIKAAEILVREYGMDNLKFYLIGEGKSRDYLQMMIDDADLNDTVFLVGNKKREWVYQNLCNYDIFVLSSRFEGFGLSIAEAMAAKVPVISSDIYGPAEILGNGEFGYLFEMNNHLELAKKIIEVIDLFKTGLIDQKVQSAYANCIENYDIKITTQNYCKAYLN